MTNRDIAATFNSFFDNAVSSLDINANADILNHVPENLTDPIDRVICKYKVHPSILTIKNKINIDKTFSFSHINITDVKREIDNLNSKKATTNNNIPTKILKLTSDTISNIVHKLFNDCLESSSFPDNFKLADITPVLKKGSPLDKTNYRPVSVLPALSKVFERLIQNQINDYIVKYLSPYLCGFRKGLNTQQALLSLTEKWKTTLDKKGFGGAVLMDLSKVLDTLDFELLIAKLHAYGFQKKS